MLDSRRVLAPAPKELGPKELGPKHISNPDVLGPKHISNPDVAPFRFYITSVGLAVGGRDEVVHPGRETEPIIKSHRS